MRHLGDITKINGSEIEPVDVITGGSPCQDLSIAGNRKGLGGERSGLFMEQIRIIKEMREASKRSGRTGEFVQCRYAVWENVPGAFSSNKGRDFQAVLTEFVRISEPDAPDVPMPEKGRWPKSGWLYDELGGWSVAWRQQDARFWGVPQRRKRIALVADFNGLTAPTILFDPQYRRETERTESDETVSDSGGERRSEVQALSQSLSGDPEPGGTPWQEIAEGAEGSPCTAGECGATAWTYRGRENGCNVEMQDELSYSLRNPSEGGSQPNILARGAISFQERAGKPGGARESLSKVNTSGLCPPSTINPSSQQVTASFMGGQGSKAGGLGYQEEVSPSLKSEASGTNTVPDVLHKEPIPINDKATRFNGGEKPDITTERGTV